MSITALAPSAAPAAPALGGVVDSVLADLDRALSRLNAVDWSGAGGGRLLEWGGRVWTAMSRLAAVRLAVVAAVQAAGAARATGAKSTAEWSRAQGTGAGAARRQVYLAEALVEHAATREGLAAGRCSSEQAEVVAGFLDALSDDVSAEVRAAAEADLLERAAILDPKGLAQAATGWAARIDPAGSGDLESKERAAKAGRDFTRYRGRDGMWKATGQLDTEGAAYLMAAIDPLAAPRPCTVDGPDPRTPGRRRGDALVQLAQLALANTLLPVNGGVAATVMVTMTLQQLTTSLQHAGLVDPDGCATTESEGCALIAGGTVREPISAGLARRLACEAGIIPVVLGGPSEVLDLGRARRLASPAQRKALTVRDQGCSRPRCDTPPAWTQAHHVTWWDHGGHTNVSQMTLVCDHCHDLVHHHGWTITMTNGQPTWHPPAHPPPPDTEPPGDPP